MKKFDNVEIEVIKLNMADIIATSDTCTAFVCSTDSGKDNTHFDSKDSDWDED